MGLKVTKDLLDRYRKLKQEIPVLELELLMMKNTEAGLGNDTIFDYQTGYPRPQSVVGFDQKKYIAGRRFWSARKKRSKPWTSGLMTSRTDRPDACSGCSTNRT